MEIDFLKKISAFSIVSVFGQAKNASQLENNFSLTRKKAARDGN